MNKKQIGLLIVEIKWPPETFLLRKIEGLAQKGVEVTASVVSSQKRLKGLPSSGNIKIFRLSSTHDPLFFKIFLRIKYIFLLLIKRPRVFRIYWSNLEHHSLKVKFSRIASLRLALEKPDIVHFEWNTAAIDYSYMFGIWDCPIVVSCRGSQINIRAVMPYNQKFVAGLKKNFEEATAVHCVSEAIKDEALQYGLIPEKAWVIHPAVDPDYFCPAPHKNNSDATLRIVTTGSLVWIKGLEYALIAIRKLVDAGRNIHFEIIGDGQDYQRVLYTIDDLNLKAHVHLAGKLSPDEVRERLQWADVFLLSSLSEGISNSVLEAMACGLPVVTTDCGGMREAVEHGVEGFVVPVRDPQAISEAIEALISNPDLRQAMGLAARARIVKEFTLEQQTNQFIALYEKCINESSLDHKKEIRVRL